MLNGVKRLAILGSTGSIGTQALEVVKEHSEKFHVKLLSAYSNANLLIKQALEFQPTSVVIGDEKKYLYVKEALKNTEIKVYAGESAINEVLSSNDIDLVLLSMVGFAGLKPALKCLEYHKDIALANKEVLVVAGDYVMREAQRNNINIIPVDSEHSAILQSLIGENHSEIEKIILTASGGPFRGKTKEELKNVTLQEALKHPNWCMGKKITIDSATLMNKGLEVIEAKHLFNLSVEQIDVIIHPQSIIHSMIQFVDGSIKAQLGTADMRLPIMYALYFPQRLKSNFARLDFTTTQMLTFEKVDKEAFPCLSLAYYAIENEGTLPCALNAANEVAVNEFLHEKIRFIDIPSIIEKTLLNSELFIKNPTIEEYFEIDKEARVYAKKIINENKF